MKKEIKNNEVMNAVENIEVKNLEIEPIMDEAQMKQYVEENIHIVPKNQRNKFESMTLDQKVSKISFYYDMQKLREEAKVKNSIPNKVREIFDKRHASIDDARTVLQFCTEFIDNFKQREIDKIDEQIRQLELMKQSL